MSRQLNEFEQKQVSQLSRLFERRNGDGTYYYSDQDVRNFLPLLVLDLGLNVNDSPPLRELMTEFLNKVGYRSGISSNELQMLVDAYWRKNPVKEQLIVEFRHCVRELASLPTNELAKEVRTLLGSVTGRVPPRHDEAPPANTFSSIDIRTKK